MIIQATILNCFWFCFNENSTSAWFNYLSSNCVKETFYRSKKCLTPPGAQIWNPLPENIK